MSTEAGTMGRGGGWEYKVTEISKALQESVSGKTVAEMLASTRGISSELADILKDLKPMLGQLDYSGFDPAIIRGLVGALIDAWNEKGAGEEVKPARAILVLLLLFHLRGGKVVKICKTTAKSADSTLMVEVVRYLNCLHVAEKIPPNASAGSKVITLPRLSAAYPEVDIMACLGAGSHVFQMVTRPGTVDLNKILSSTQIWIIAFLKELKPNFKAYFLLVALNNVAMLNAWMNEKTPKTSVGLERALAVLVNNIKSGPCKVLEENEVRDIYKVVEAEMKASIEHIKRQRRELKKSAQVVQMAQQQGVEVEELDMTHAFPTPSLQVELAIYYKWLGSLPANLIPIAESAKQVIGDISNELTVEMNQADVTYHQVAQKGPVGGVWNK
jgi:hypothetical protein